MVNQRRLSRLALFASFFSLCVIALGAFTRLMDAGLGCPDWPGCYGHLVVPAVNEVMHSSYSALPLVSYKAWAEMVHRYFVGGLSLLILVIVSLIVSCKLLRTRLNLLLAVFLCLLVSYQILLGQWTVTLKLMPIIVTQHLLGGFFILSTLWAIYLNNRVLHLKIQSFKSNGLFFFASIGLVLVLVQIFLGAWTSTNYASLSCPDFPFCSRLHPLVAMQFKEAFTLHVAQLNYEGGVLQESVRQTIQMTHRYGALIVFTYLMVFVAFASFALRSQPSLLKPLYSVLALLFVQIALGITNAMFHLPLAVAISHTLVAALLVITLLTFIFNLRRAQKAMVL